MDSKEKCSHHPLFLALEMVVLFAFLIIYFIKLISIYLRIKGKIELIYSKNRIRNPNYGLEIEYNIKKKSRKSASYTINNPYIIESNSFAKLLIAGQKVLNISSLQNI